MEIYAHTRRGEPEHTWELLPDHLAAVAALAADFARPFGAGEAARAAGLLHDIGKCTEAFQRYIRGDGPSPDHSSAGAVIAAERYGPLLGSLIAFAVAGHHSGLADGAGSGGLRARLERHDLSACPGWADHVPDLPVSLTVALPNAHGHVAPPGYAAAFLGRMLFSCLIDADRLATETFEHGTTRPVPAAPGDLRDRLDAHMDRLSAGKTGALNALRADILAHARAKAALPPGLFTMTVPTGGGKTLASLAFALDHAARHGLDRVIYVIPYTSIIEQTAAVFRDAIGDANVLEHHGNVDWEDARPPTDAEGRDAAALRRATENWDMPVVVTTAVQFFESLHAARARPCRKLHNIARSVVVLDEAQMLPVRLLRPCMAAIAELAGNYGTSIVLCTATQPALKKQDGFAGGLDICEARELAPDPADLYDRLRRVTVERLPEPVADAVIAARFADAPQMLCIVNSRRHAQMLFDAVRHLPGARHLTTLMCPAHRRQVLAAVRDDLKHGRPVRLVATSLIEAGVDVDFPEVWRAETGLDSIAQAAGRCNREGGRDKGRVVVFAPAEHAARPEFQPYIDATNAVMDNHGADLFGPDAMRAYFARIYWQQGDGLDAGTIREGGEEKVFPILKHIRAARITHDYPYAGIDEAFRMIQDKMLPVIIPWPIGDRPGKARMLVEKLRASIQDHGRPSRDVMRQLQQYTVSVPTWMHRRMLALPSVEIVHKHYGDRFVMLTAEQSYSEDTGLAMDEYAGEPKDFIFGSI